MMKKIRRVSTAIAARILDKSEDFIRWGLQQGRVPIGSAVQTGPKRWSYHVSPKLLADYSGLSIDESLFECDKAETKVDDVDENQKTANPAGTGKAVARR